MALHRCCTLHLDLQGSQISKGLAPSLAALKCTVAIRCVTTTAGLGGLWTLDSAVNECASPAATGYARHERGMILGL
jgi:hypothetical protein